MSAIPNSYDMLAISGILPYDVNEIVYEKPSAYFESINPHHSSPEKDEFNHDKKEKAEGKEKEPLEPKKLGLIALGIYLTGCILSKSKNPIKGAEAIGKTLWNIIKLPVKIFKK